MGSRNGGLPCQPACPLEGLSAASMTIDHPPEDEAGSEAGQGAGPELEGHESTLVVCIE